MMSGFLHDVDPQVAPIVLASLFLALILECLCVILMLLKRGRGVEIAAVCGWVLPFFGSAVAWRSVVRQIGEAFQTSDPGDKAAALAGAMSTHLNVAALSCLVMLPLTALATTALLISIQRRSKSTLAAFAIAAAGGAAVVLFAGGIAHVTKLVAYFQAIASSEPSVKADLLREGLKESLVPLQAGAVVAGVAALVAAALGIAAALRTPSKVSPVSAVLLALGGMLVIEAWPLFRENTAPALPYSSTGSMVEPVPGLHTPELLGSDPIQRAPIVSIAPDRMMIEGVVVAGALDLGAKLVEMRKIDEMMHPGQPFAGALIWVVDGQVTGEVFARALDAGRSRGFVRGTLVFVREGTIERPVFGALHLTGATGARFELEAGEERIELKDGERFAAIAERVVAARRGQKVVVLIGPDAAAHAE